MKGLTGVIGYCWLQNKWKYWQRKGVSGPKPSLADLGNTLSTFNDLGVGLFEKYADQDVIGIYFFFTQPCLIVKDPSVWKEVAIKGFHNFTTRGRSEANFAFGKMAPDFVTLAEGQKWKRIRNTIVPFFSGARLKETCLVLQDTYEHYENTAIPKSATTEVDAKAFAAGLTLRAILGSGLGLSAKENEELVDEVYRHANILFQTSFWGFIKTSTVPRWIRYKLNMTNYPSSTDDFFREVIAQIMEQKSSGRTNLVSLMANNIIENSQEYTATKGLTKDEIIAQTLIFKLAGQDTTATALSFLLFALAKTPSVQEEIYNQVKNADLSYEGLKKIKFIDACIKEAMRFFKFIVLLREADQDCEVAGVKIDKGTLLLFLPNLVHRSAEFYENPDVFNPHRFDGNESNTLQDDYWFGFGIGPRSCPAVRWAFVSIKIFVANILKTYELLPGENTPELNDVKVRLAGPKIETTVPMKIRFRKRA